MYVIRVGLFCLVPALAAAQLFDNGGTPFHDDGLPAKNRTNVPIASDFFLTSASRFGILVESVGLQQVPIVVERATTRARAA